MSLHQLYLNKSEEKVIKDYKTVLRYDSMDMKLHVYTYLCFKWEKGTTQKDIDNTKQGFRLMPDKWYRRHLFVLPPTYSSSSPHLHFCSRKHLRTANLHTPASSFNSPYFPSPFSLLFPEARPVIG